MVLNHDQAVRYGRLGALHQQSRHDTRQTTAKARSTFLSRFERQVDPDSTLPAVERARRAQAALKAHMTALAYKSAASRGAKKAAKPVTPQRPHRPRMIGSLPVDCAGCARDEGRAYYDNATDRVCARHLAQYYRQLEDYRKRHPQPTSAA